MTPKRLPTFKGYVVDIRSLEFRKMALGETVECISFVSEEGMDLIEAMDENFEAIQTYHGEKPWEVAYEADKAMRRTISMRQRYEKILGK